MSSCSTRPERLQAARHRSGARVAAGPAIAAGGSRNARPRSRPAAQQRGLGRAHSRTPSRRAIAIDRRERLAALMQHDVDLELVQRRAIRSRNAARWRASPGRRRPRATGRDRRRSVVRDPRAEHAHRARAPNTALRRAPDRLDLARLEPHAAILGSAPVRGKRNAGAPRARQRVQNSRWHDGAIRR